ASSSCLLNNIRLTTIKIILISTQQTLHYQHLDSPTLIRHPLVFPEQLTLLQALELFRSARTHFAFVIDEFGSVEGVVTLSDVMETIVGNLPHEGERLDPRYDIQQNADGNWTANGHMPLEDLVTYLPLEEKRISNACWIAHGTYAAAARRSRIDAESSNRSTLC
ncbi:transporter, partial [Erwinia tracheiphila PSU-1]